MTFIKTTATRLITFTLSSLLAISVQAAETMSHDMGQMQGMTMSATQQKTYPLNGRVVAVDNANLQVTLEHDAVTELQWPAMTMPFKVADAKLLEGLQPGQSIMAMFTTNEGEAPTIVSLHTM